MKYYEQTRMIGDGTAGSTLISYCLALAMLRTTITYDAKFDYADNFKLGESRNMVKARKRCVFRSGTVLTARRNRTENATQLQRQLLLATGQRVFSQTVRNRLHEGGFYARRTMVCIPLTPRHRAARRRWAAEHRGWEQHDWSQLLFTDECRFSLECDTRRVLVWRKRGTRNNPAFVRERSQYRRDGWMVWGGISIGGRTDLHIIWNGTLTGQRYADEILRPLVIPYAGAIGDSFVFQDDNARPHRARLV
ncbi:transposable element Tcb2 transposase [Trichonephila clavipes]|nr:transposable element Tcb2 transposase [Trichonephila clavipes]